MSWIKIDDALPGHPKVRKLQALLGRRADAVGVLVRLWIWANDYAKDGDLSSFDPVDVTIACGLVPDRRTDILEMLVACRLVDREGHSLKLHDWQDHQGGLLEMRARNRQRESARRARLMQEPCAHAANTCAPREGQEERRGEEKRNTPHYPPAADAAGGGRSVSGIPEGEIAWRVDQVWAAHLAQWGGFFADTSGIEPKVPPELTEDIRRDIVDCLQVFDARLLGFEDREAWLRDSKVRASGVGIFLDAWCTGKHRANDAADGGRRYLEHWRPWRKQRRKGYPVEQFAELYFEARDARDVA